MKYFQKNHEKLDVLVRGIMCVYSTLNADPN